VPAAAEPGLYLRTPGSAGAGARGHHISVRPLVAPDDGPAIRGCSDDPLLNHNRARAVNLALDNDGRGLDVDRSRSRIDRLLLHDHLALRCWIVGRCCARATRTSNGSDNGGGCNDSVHEGPC
jgi:hypothetical protein